MEVATLAEFLLSVAATIAFLFVLASRVEAIRHPAAEHDEYVIRRFILVDVLLVIAGVELMSDAFRTDSEFALLISFACKGAIMAGGLALALSIHDDQRRDRTLVPPEARIARVVTTKHQ